MNNQHLSPQEKEKMPYPLDYERMEILRVEPDHTFIDDKFGRHIGVHDCDAVRLAWLASQVPDAGSIVEIGSFWGRSTGYMAAACKGRGVTIRCYDLWPNPDDMEHFQRNMKSLGYDKFVVSSRQDSVEAVASYQAVHGPDPSIDLLFIDGDHSWEGVKRDYEAWVPLVKSGGIVAFHDYGTYAWGEVQRFVDSVAQIELQITGVYQRVWSGRKP